MRSARLLASSTPAGIAPASFDAAGRQIGMSDALGNLTTWQFDAASRKVLRIDGRGLRTSYSYDAASRLTGQQYQDGTRASMVYDANSQRTVLSDWTGSYTSTYDPVGRLSSVVNPAGIGDHLRLRCGRPAAWMNQPTGLFSYVFDPAGGSARWSIPRIRCPPGRTTRPAA